MKKWGPAGPMTGSSAGHDPCVAQRTISTILELFSLKFFNGLENIKMNRTTMAIENCNKGSISIKTVKSTKIGLEETESNKACTH